ncbi:MULTISPECIES: DUF1127 domain-containing protein [unclassified Modicisalibacter]|uniref:DUF1127 domain-containing protein n=1 Tax=unclassified Modicisalibacter TaxID=2679913 RepID=UPI001CCA400D|nr:MULTISPECIES: DUF1127 domain-containing protein [unclassified Modicisalibacter]MBZ9557528.1 DUF1127 domain-containing protein [Modicisalibacter sp. R2A 31.J]MBZ9573807.1 DUF1127 domain-containing protein [Modicisalibacter sp. MOD 31.J]
MKTLIGTWLCNASSVAGWLDRAPARRDRLARWRRRLARWSRLRHERQQLRHLSDAMLRDIGLTRDDVEREASRPFWDDDGTR